MFVALKMYAVYSVERECFDRLNFAYIGHFHEIDFASEKLRNPIKTMSVLASHDETDSTVRQ